MPVIHHRGNHQGIVCEHAYALVHDDGRDVDGEAHHWLHVDPNGDWWLQHPSRDLHVEDLDCHRTLEQCPIHLHLAHQRLRHADLRLNQLWKSKVPGAPHHSRHQIIGVSAGAISLVGPNGPFDAELYKSDKTRPQPWLEASR